MSYTFFVSSGHLLSTSILMIENISKFRHFKNSFLIAKNNFYIRRPHIAVTSYHSIIGDNLQINVFSIIVFYIYTRETKLGCQSRGCRVNSFWNHKHLIKNVPSKMSKTLKLICLGFLLLAILHLCVVQGNDSESSGQMGDDSSPSKFCNDGDECDSVVDNITDQ